MKVFSIIQLALLTIVVSTIIGCDREVHPPEILSDELTFTATKSVANGQLNASAQTESTLENFTVGSKIGLFTQLKSQSDANSDVVIKSNSLYAYDTPVWSPASSSDKLSYAPDPIYVFGYYPHTSMPGANTTVVDGSTNVDFILNRDQSLPLSVLTSDLLWVGAKNESNGYSRQREPINLLFEHRMCKVSFYLRLIDSDPSQSNPTKAYLRNLAAIGEQIMSRATLNVLNGSIQGVANANGVDSVYWNSPSENAIELVVGAEAVLITDMLLIPFAAVQGQNYFRSMLYYETEGISQNFNAYIPAFDPNASGGSAGKLCFEPNKHNKVTITIDISDNFTNITAQIAPWEQGSESDLPSEPQ